MTKAKVPSILTHTLIASILAGGMMISGCKSNETKSDTAQAQPAQESSKPATQSTAAAAPAPAAQQKPVCKDQPAAKKDSKKKSKSKKDTTTTDQPADCVPASQATAQPASAPPPPPAAEPQAAQSPKASGGYDLSKNKPITDSSKAESGQGTMVKGINDWEGEISGIPAPGSAFNKLKIGMSREEVFDRIGYPTDQGAYVTGKAWIPFYHGGDRVRWEAVYKGYGRLVFSQQGGWGGSSEFHLTWIIHNSHEGGYR